MRERSVGPATSPLGRSCERDRRRTGFPLRKPRPHLRNGRCVRMSLRTRGGSAGARSLAAAFSAPAAPAWVPPDAPTGGPTRGGFFGHFHGRGKRSAPLANPGSATFLPPAAPPVRTLSSHSHEGLRHRPNSSTPRLVSADCGTVRRQGCCAGGAASPRRRGRPARRSPRRKRARGWPARCQRPLRRDLYR